MKYLILALLALLLPAPLYAQFGMGGAKPPTSVNGFTYVRQLRWNHENASRTMNPPASMTGFPVLVDSKINPELQNDLKILAYKGVVTSDRGYDIVFFPDALCGLGAPKLNFEIDHYDNTTGEYIAWVNRNASQLFDIYFYACYGKASVTTSQENKNAVWNPEYEGVFHISQFAGEDFTVAQDSTVHDHGGKPLGPTYTPGKMGAAAKMHPGDLFTLGNQFYQLTDSKTIEMWYHLDTAPTPGSPQSLYKKLNGAQTIGTNISVTNEVGAQGVRALFGAGAQGSALIVEGIQAQAGDTKQVTVVYNRAVHTLYLYVDCVLIGTYDYYPSAVNLDDSDFLGDGLLGWLDEVRLSSVARPHDWVVTSCLQMTNPALILSIGPRL